MREFTGVFVSIAVAREMRHTILRSKSSSELCLGLLVIGGCANLRVINKMIVDNNNMTMLQHESVQHISS